MRCQYWSQALDSEGYTQCDRDAIGGHFVPIGAGYDAWRVQACNIHGVVPIPDVPEAVLRKLFNEPAHETGDQAG